MTKIIFTGGGTGGHVMKNVAVISELKKSNPEIEIEYIGSGAEYEREPLSKLGVKYHKIPTGKLRRYLSLSNITDIFSFMMGIGKSAKLLKQLKPDIIFSSGGFVALPVCIAAYKNKTPVITHESDSVPGLANRLIAKTAKKICVAFETAKKHFPKGKVVLTGNPIRKELTQGTKEKGYSLTGFTESKPAILIMGGSQGAQKINDLIGSILPELTDKYQIVHLTGKGKETKHEGKNYKQYDFIEAKELANIYKITDLVVSRAGANAIAEITEVGIPNILIPLSTAASSHQYYNALEMKRMGCSELLDERRLEPGILYKEIGSLMKDEERKQEMRKNMEKLRSINPAEKIVEVITSL
jgi:UDP-N-acetylglucosamine--N-acetylmuramyl-(pentapeptide) pyrophosphoryl-undecaprenol N-acetylglucosamine transferase